MSPREALEAATPALKPFETALRAGRLVICAQCGEYTFARDPDHIGHCGRFNVEAWPFAPFPCDGFVRRQRKAA